MDKKRFLWATSLALAALFVGGIQAIPLAKKEAPKKRQKYTSLPCGGGRRSCIGGAMSQVENTLALSILLRRFQPEYVGTNPPGIQGTVTLTPRGGLDFKIHERARQ